MSPPDPHPDPSTQEAAAARSTGTPLPAALWLGLALVLGSVRFLRLGRWSLWYDEALTVADAWVPRGVNYNGPAYALVRWGVALGGGVRDEAGLRLAAALCGWLAIPACAWAFRPLAGARRAALAALLLASSAWALHWSQNARPYTPALLLSLIGSGVALRGLLSGRLLVTLLGLALLASASRLQLSAAVLAASLALAPTGALLLGARPGPAARRVALWVLLVAGVAALAGLPWLRGVWHAYQREKQEFVGLTGVLHFARSAGFLVTPTLGLGALLGTWVAWRRREFPGLVAVLPAGLGALAVGLLGTLAQTTGQYVFVLLPWACLAAVWPLPEAGVGGVRTPAGGVPVLARRGPAAAYLGLLLLPGWAGQAFELGPGLGNRPRYREAFACIAERRGPDDLVLAMQAGLGDLYLEPGSVDARYPHWVGWVDRTNAENLLLAGRTPRATWLLVRPDFLAKWPERSRAWMIRFLAEECREVRRYDVPSVGRDLSLVVYERPAGR